ncbi:hypothetical protein W822_12395 [Advenella kashmirensis W13003]|uniref:HTH gntR-type domain-containing protein n=2 Tax=Advenella kashmirensis TaxID=310575 RepID=V8QSP0_9BURK|nr:hypothetical protein W822_12395 [Advenella kashmirensis W13003]
MQLATLITSAIAEGVFSQGQQLPTESELTEACGVSRVTVRQAFQLLIQNGQIVSRRGKGTFVARLNVQHDLSGLQGFLEVLRSQGVEPETELLEFSASAGRKDLSRPHNTNLPVRLRRRYRVDGEAFAVVEAYMPPAAGQVGFERAEYLSVYEILKNFLGISVARADVSIQCARPSSRILKELDLDPKSQVLIMSRSSFNAANVICEHMRIYIVPERYTFKMSVAGPLNLASSVSPNILNVSE